MVFRSRVTDIILLSVVCITHAGGAPLDSRLDARCSLRPAWLSSNRSGPWHTLKDPTHMADPVVVRSVAWSQGEVGWPWALELCAFGSTRILRRASRGDDYRQI